MKSAFARSNRKFRQPSRLWQASSIAAVTLLAIFASAAFAKRVVVKVAEAPIKVGDDTIGTAKYGERFEVRGERGGFYQIEFVTPENRRRKGWLWQEHVNVSDEDERSDGSGDESDDRPSAAASEVEPSPSLAAILALHQQGRFREAIALAERLAGSYEKQGGKATPEAADAYYMHARLYGDLREHDKAFELYDRGLLASLDANGIRSYRTAACALGLAEAAYGRGQIGLMRHCLRLTDQLWSHIREQAESQLGNLQARGEDTALHDASGQATRLMQHDPPSDITMLHMHSGFISAMRMGGVVPAEDIDKMERLLTPEKHDNPQLEEAELSTDWALLLMRLGHFDRAETFASRGLELRKEQADARSPLVADSLHVLGQIKFAAGDYAGCRRRCIEALDVLGGFKAGTIASAVVMRTLMQTGLRENDLDEAARYGGQALQVYEEQFGDDHADTVACRGEVATVRATQKQSGEALRLYDAAARGHYRSAAALWTFADDALAGQGPHGNGALACAVDERGKVEAARMSAEWLINFKGLLTDRRARDFVSNGQWYRGYDRTLREHPEDAAARSAFAAKLLPLGLYECERTVLRRKIFIQRHGVLQQATPELLSSLQDVDRRFQATLAEMAESTSDKKEEPWLRLDELRKRLPADTWLLECARYRVPSPSAEEAASRYAAWIIPPAGKGKVEIVPLGEADEVDRLIAALRKTLRTGGSKIGKDEANAEHAWQETAGKLAKAAILPVWDRLPAGCRRLLIAPDAALWDVPWGAMPVSDGKYAIEQKAIDYLISERSLLQDAAATTAAGAAVVFADPDFDADVQAIRQDAGQQMMAMLYHIVARGISQNLPKAPRLPGTRQEAEAIIPFLKQIEDDAPVLYTGRDANSINFQILKSPQILVMSTHGFYLKSRFYSEETTLPRIGSAAPVVTVKKPQDFLDPLDRCGLLLAGCNERPSGDYDKYRNNGDYGIISGRTVAATDLSATELVVLSACDTSLGQSAANGEMESLRQAFHIAGARQVVATLWSIPDKETVQLMKEFFERLAKHQAPAAALRDAQIEIIRQRRSEHGAAHPLYWAAFEMSLRQLEAEQSAD